MIFLLTFTFIYFLLNGYALLRLEGLFAWPRFLLWTLRSWTACMILTPFATRIFEHRGWIAAAEITAWPGYFWMAFVFLFFCFGLPLELLVRLVPRIPARPVFLGLLVAVISILVYGVYEASNIRLKTLRVPTFKLPAGSPRIRIVQVTDLHLGVINGARRAERILDIVCRARPDLLVSTGDLIDGALPGEDAVCRAFRRIDAPLGKYAVTGNHEFYRGIERALAFTRACGFTLLRGEGEPAGEFLFVVGVDDPAGIRIEGNRETDEAALLKNAPENRFTLFLKHQPVVNPGAAPYFDLKLAGHVHGGQVFPFHLFTRMVYPVRVGRLEEVHGARLYVSPGTGTWGPPVRFLARPEVTLIELVPKGPRGAVRDGFNH